MKKITEKQYLRAVEIINNYNQQKKIENAKNKTPLSQWIDEIDENISTRLINRLIEMSHLDNIYLQDIDYKLLTSSQKHNLGKKSWEEFIKLRGY